MKRLDVTQRNDTPRLFSALTVPPLSERARIADVPPLEVHSVEELAFIPDTHKQYEVEIDRRVHRGQVIASVISRDRVEEEGAVIPRYQHNRYMWQALEGGHPGDVISTAIIMHEMTRSEVQEFESGRGY